MDGGGDGGGDGLGHWVRRAHNAIAFPPGVVP